MSSRDFLVELGTEELPPKALPQLASAFEAGIVAGLKEQHLGFGATQVYATPRRLAVLVKALQEKAPDQDLVISGPPERVAFGDDGTPSKAAEAFAKKNGLNVADLQLEDSDKGRRLVHRTSAPGAIATEQLPGIISQSLTGLPIPKRMRWGASRNEFVRPVHWLVLLFGDQVVDACVLGLSAGRETRGHRFHCPSPFNIDTPMSYADQLKDHGYVIADFSERRSLIKQQVKAQADSIGAIAAIDESLLDEVTGLVEWPVALTGNFDDNFLQVPAEALVSSMQEHQKYFPVVDTHGALQARFIFVANLISADPGQVIGGNERVIRPRLADAAFFYENDLKTPLAERCKRLESVVFQAKLGTVWEKSLRVASLAHEIADVIGGDPALAERAARLAKADLVSDMVQEFGDLQGIAGSYYAIKDGEPDEVAAAMKEQYLPKFAGDVLPETLTGIAVALADRIDTMVGIFGIKQPPTGSKDPFALRRAALGIIRIINEKALLGLDLHRLLGAAISNYATTLSNENTMVDVSAFIFERYRPLFQDQGVEANSVIAVQNVLQGGDQTHNPHDFALRVQAVEAFRVLPQAGALSAANKRVQNILAKQSKDAPVAAVDTKLLSVDAEITLYEKLKTLTATVPGLCDSRNYSDALATLAQLKEPVDAFFDNVMVMDEDMARRSNRINLLRELNQLFIRIADISQLQF